MVDINALIDEVLGLLRAKLQGKNITVRFTRGEELSSVLGDPIQLRQVILNLVINAVEAIGLAEDGPREIRIVTNRTIGRRVNVTICDSALGVKEVRSATNLRALLHHQAARAGDGAGDQ